MRLFPRSTGPYPYIWTVLWLSQYFYQVGQMIGLVKIIGIVGGLTLFIVFRQMYWASDWSLVAWLLLGAAAVSTVAIMSADPFIILYGLMFAFLFGYADRLLQLVVGMVGLALSLVIVSLALKGNQSALFHTYLFIWMLIELAIPIAIFSFERTRKLHRQLDHANERIIELTRQQERNRFARDLHDTLGHTLTMIIMKSELAGRLIDKDGQRAKKEVSDIEQISREALTQTRQLVSSAGYRSLRAEIGEAERLLEEKEIAVYKRMPQKWPQLSGKSETMMALALREAVTNVVKHSGARHCRLTIEMDTAALVVEIADDGSGIAARRAIGNGLRTMQERLSLIGGTAAIHTNSRGTTVRLSSPLNWQQEGEGT
ncbi:MAG: sensor histidine kinase [Sporolactobacillus sp.]|nr:sensor histidine kinase [Sporolactobacillus sp.]